VRRVRDITDEENFRLKPVGPFQTIRRDFVEPEPVGTVLLLAFRITGYDKDCDGSALARLERVDEDCRTTGWTEN